MDKSRIKQAVVILYSPKELMDFTWYYCKYGNDYDWIAVCPPYGDSDAYMIELCRNSGLFSQVLVDKRNFMLMSMKDKAFLFLKMVGFFCVGQRKKLCRKIIKESIGDIKYDLAVIPCDYGILPGAFLAEARERKTVIMEDGVGDYNERSKWGILKRLNKPYDIIGFLLAKMGYANTAFRYRMRNTQYCVKFASYPEQLMYRDYMAINKLKDMTGISEETYDNLIEKIFGVDKETYVGDVIIFTASFDNFVDDESGALAATEKFINSEYAERTVILKKHPRDDKVYRFNKDIKVIEVDKNLPAEIFLNKIKVEHCFYMYPSAVILTFQKQREEFKIFYYDCIEKCNRNGNFVYDYKKQFEESMNTYNFKDDRIIKINSDI